MLRIEWMDKAGYFDDREGTLPGADQYTYITNTSAQYEIVGTVNAGEFAGDDLRLNFTGENFEYDISSDLSLTWTDANVERWQFFIDDEPLVDIHFDPHSSSADVYDTLSFRFDRGIEYLGNSYANHLTGGRGADKVYGRAGDDEVVGLAGRDSLYGGDGDDTLTGGSSADRLSGGDGDDTFIVSNRQDKIVEFARGGEDTVQSSSDFGLGRDVENLRLIGSRDLDGYGNELGNSVTGNAGDNLLTGKGGADSVIGGNGDDRLYGGNGEDYLVGGQGADVFVFRTVGEAGVSSDADRIHGVTADYDQIALSAIDANSERAGDQAFTFIGNAAFSEEAGELRYGGGSIYGDVDGDGVADLKIIISNHPHLTADDFIL